MKTVEFAIAKGIDALRESRPDLADFLEVAIAEKIKTASDEARADLEQRVEEYLETIAEQKRQIEAHDRIARQIDTLGGERVSVSIEPMSERFDGFLHTPPVNDDHVVEERVEELVRENNAAAAADEEDEAEQEWLTRLPGVPPIGALDEASPEKGGNILAMTPPAKEPEPIQDPSAEVPVVTEVNAEHIKRMLAPYNDLERLDYEPSAIVKLIAMRAMDRPFTACAPETGIPLGSMGRLSKMIEAHVKRLKLLQRPEAREEYLRQLLGVLDPKPGNRAVSS